MATPFDRFITTIRPHLPGAIDEAIRQELFVVCQDFLRRSQAWQEDIEFTLAANEREAEIVPYAGRIDRLVSVEKDGFPVSRALMRAPGTIRMPYAPSGPETYTARVALLVSDPVTRDAYPIIPYEIVERYFDTLISGVCSRMMAQQQKPYTNLSLAQFHLAKFRGEASRARNEINTGYTNGSQRWTFPQNFATSRR
jgi:hypothetical protein